MQRLRKTKPGRFYLASPLRQAHAETQVMGITRAMHAVAFASSRRAADLEIVSAVTRVDYARLPENDDALRDSNPGSSADCGVQVRSITTTPALDAIFSGGYMLIRQGAALLMMAGLATTALGQGRAEVDSLIADFVEVGYRSSWTPSSLFTGCPRLEEWQEYGFRRLASMQLSARRESDVAISWTQPLRDCGDRRLEQWYFDHFDASIRRGDWELKHSIRQALRIADSPAIREYLWNLMIDSSLAEDLRYTAGALYFPRLAPDEKLREFLRGFEANRLPVRIDWSQATVLLQLNAPALMDGMGQVVRSNPALANQAAFSQVVQSSHKYADQRDRDRLAEALEAGLAAAPGRVTDPERGLLEAAARHLRRPVR